MIKAIVTHKSDEIAGSLMAELGKIKFKNPVVDIQLSVIEDSTFDWANKNKIGPEEMLAIWFQAKAVDVEKKRRTKPTFSVNMMDIAQQPEWVNNPCWVAVLHNPDEGVVRAMAGQLWGDYIRNFDERIGKGWAPWGALPKNSSWALPRDDNQKGIEIGERIDKALVKIGLVYDSNLSTTWMSGIEYFEITQTQFAAISKLMKASICFREALIILYRENKWAREILNIGRPDFVCQWALDRGMFQDSGTKKIRLDIAIGEQGKPWVTELDGTPGGEGIEMGLRRIYLNVLGEPSKGYLLPDVADGYEQMIKEAAITGPIMFLITADASQYFPEQELKAKVLAERGIRVIVCRPEDVILDRGVVLVKGERVVAWDRFVETYELFDPHLRSLAEVSENNGFFSFPSFKNFVWEGKETFAFLHEPHLEEFWEEKMGSDNFHLLKKHTPFTCFPVQLDVDILEQKDWYRKRASMGDNQCWGSRGVVFGGKEKQDDWERQLFQDKHNFLGRTFPYHVYQQAIAHCPYRISFYERSKGKVMEGKFFVRLTPWGYASDKGILTCGIVATLRNDPKVHGAKDAVQTVSVIVPD